MNMDKREIVKNKADLLEFIEIQQLVEFAYSKETRDNIPTSIEQIKVVAGFLLVNMSNYMGHMLSEEQGGLTSEDFLNVNIAMAQDFNKFCKKYINESEMVFESEEDLNKCSVVINK